jgi:hypothetical protein
MSVSAIPVTFISDRVSLNWSEVLWGYEKKLIGWHSVVQLAENRLLNGSNGATDIELASLGKEQAGSVGDLLRQLVATSTASSEEDAKQKWLYLTLSWVFENRADYSDPLAVVEEVYADFDYPERISPVYSVYARHRWVST